MKINKQSLLLIAVLIIIVLIVEGITLSMLYSAAFEQQRAQLTATAQSQAKLMSAIARFDKAHNDEIHGSVAITMHQIRDAHLEKKSFGKSGEFLIGKIENNKIDFLIPYRFKVAEKDKEKKQWLRLGSAYAVPMQLALSGKSGTIIDKDYRGENVLAAYEPINVLNYGLVVKIDISEIRAPYIYVGLISITIALILISLGSLIFLRITNPIIKGLETSASQLNDAQRLAKIGSWELDLLSNELSWSDEMYHLFEMDKQKFGASYEAFLNAIHPDDRDMVNKAYTDSLVNRQTYEIGHRLVMRDGSVRYVNETCETFFDENYKPLRSVGTTQDITELYNAQQNIERLASIVKYSSDFIGIADMEGKPLFLNDSGRKLVGIQDDNQLFSLRVIDFFPPAAQETFNTEIMPALLDKGQWMGEINFRNIINGDEIAVWFNIFRIDDPTTGQAKSIATVTRDIRKQKAVDAELKQHREHLEELVEDRTANMKLARDEAEKANAAKTHFLSSMSHELRTPMNAILGFSQLLAMDTKDESMKENLNEILNAGDHLLELINQVLDLSKIESGSISLLIKSHNLNDLLNDCLSLINPVAAKYSITIDNKVDPSLNPMINVDEGRFKQVLLNLLSNAIKYNSENGKVTINCSSNDKNMLCLSISDTGKGLTPEQKSHLFKPFDRAGAENSNISGTGLGLVISKDLMEKMNGTIDFDSEVGKGSCFEIKIPSS